MALKMRTANFHYCFILKKGDVSFEDCSLPEQGRTFLLKEAIMNEWTVEADDEEDEEDTDEGALVNSGR